MNTKFHLDRSGYEQTYTQTDTKYKNSVKSDYYINDVVAIKMSAFCPSIELIFIVFIEVDFCVSTKFKSAVNLSILMSIQIVIINL